jgi:glyoxylase-like metal-dependent hydrolase (beta-lactamase superfamily II)
MTNIHKWFRLFAVLILLGGSVLFCFAHGKTSAPENKSAHKKSLAPAATLRLYVLDGGKLLFDDPTEYGLTKAQVAETNMAVPVFLIVHPHGALLWDTGLGDDLIGRPVSEITLYGYGQVVTTTVASQLAAIGYTPNKIKYLAISHMHFDHVGNANDYAASIWLVQTPEWNSVFGPGADVDTKRFNELRNSKTIKLTGDYDVFGDGTVVIKSTPGHTPGHQCLFLKLGKTGPVVLGGDLYHYPAERTYGKMPPEEAVAGGTAASRAAMDQFLKKTGATLWIQHDLIVWRTLKKSPDYYD